MHVHTETRKQRSTHRPGGELGDGGGCARKRARHEQSHHTLAVLRCTKQGARMRSCRASNLHACKLDEIPSNNCLLPLTRLSAHLITANACVRLGVCVTRATCKHALCVFPRPSALSVVCPPTRSQIALRAFAEKLPARTARGNGELVRCEGCGMIRCSANCGFRSHAGSMDGEGRAS